MPSESTNSTQGNQSTILGGAILSDNKDTTFVPENQILEKESTDTQVAQAEQDTDIEPTEAQKEAGNSIKKDTREQGGL